MTILLTDEVIGSLLKEKKVVSEDFWKQLKMKSKRGHKEFETEIIGETGSIFSLRLRQSELNPFDFSVILLYLPEGSNQQFRLRRYNGKNHEHTNPKEDQTFYGYHIHTATERYQQSAGHHEDTFAEVTTRYANYLGAVECMIEDCGFEFSSINHSLTQFLNNGG